MEEKKRKHHVVFQAYLKSRAVEDRVWCLRDRTKSFSALTERISNVRDFYRLKPINIDEERFYRLLIKVYPEDVQRSLLEHLSAYKTPFILEKKLKVLKQQIINKMKSIPKKIEEDFKKLESYIDIGKNNIEEDYHCIIENESKTWLDELKNKSTKFYYSGLGKEKTDNAYDDEAYHFLYFLSVQLFRTQSNRERWIFSFQKAINSL